MRYFVLIFFVVLFTSCAKHVNNQDVVEKNTGFIGVQTESPYGYVEMCKRAWRLHEANIFCSKNNLCEETRGRVTFDANNRPVAGLVSDIEFIKEFCQ